MAGQPDWRAAVTTHAARAGVDLPQAIADEMALHLDDLYVAALAEGQPEAEASARAFAALEESAMSVLGRRALRDARSPDRRQADAVARTSQGRSLHVLSALRMALRQFRQHPGFACITVLVLGLGTGAATTIHTVVDAVVLRPLPYERPDRLVTLWAANAPRGLAHDPISPVDFMDYRALPVFTDAAAWWRPAIDLVEPGEDPVRVNTIEVSANLFTLLGVRPQMGQGFPEQAELYARNEPTVVISDRLWRARFDADPTIVGRQITLSDVAHTVVGVMPRKFHYPDDIDVWQRLGWDFRQHHRAARFLESVARLSEGTTIDRAAAATDALSLRLQTEFAPTNKGWGVRLIPLLDEALGYYRPALIVLFGAVGLLLVIGCLNVASLLLVRSLSREREIAVRIALGAAPRQLVVQLLAESLVLSVAGALLGLAIAATALPLLVALSPVQIPRLDEARIGLRGLGLGLGVVSVTTVIFGLLPAALLLREQLTTGLRSAERGSSRGARRIYSVLVVGEVALACVLLVSSALLVRTVAGMMRTPTGVNADDVLTTKVQLGGAVYRDWRGVADTHARLLQEVRQQPGVTAAGATNVLPFEIGWRMPFSIEGQPPPARPEDAPQAQYQTVSDGYFETMGAEILRGRAFSSTIDTTDSVPVVVVNETFATRFLTGGRTVGRSVRTGAFGVGPLGRNLIRARDPKSQIPIPFEVVGIVRDVRNAPLGQSMEPAIYFASTQFPFRELFLTVRATTRPAAVEAVAAALRRVAPTVPSTQARTWGEIRAARTAEPRLLMSVLVFFGALAAVLAAIGVYGLFSWTVALRTRELAIRLTLGARPSRVGGLVLQHGAVLIGAGLVSGILLIRLAHTALSRVLFDVAPGDLGATLTASVVLLLAALVACVPPALRAMRVNPLEGLRTE
jgi:putative ABC transport system permease protein